MSRLNSLENKTLNSIREDNRLLLFIVIINNLPYLIIIYSSINCWRYFGRVYAERIQKIEEQLRNK